MDAAADEKKIGNEFKLPNIVWAGENCNLTREQNREVRLEKKRLRLLAIKEFRANNPRPRNKSNFTVKRSFCAPVPVTYLDHLREPGAGHPEDGVLPGIRAIARARAKELNKDLGVSSEENHKIYQPPVTKAFAELQNVVTSGKDACVLFSIFIFILIRWATSVSRTFIVQDWCVSIPLLSLNDGSGGEAFQKDDDLGAAKSQPGLKSGFYSSKCLKTEATGAVPTGRQDGRVWLASKASSFYLSRLDSVDAR
ncbi:hypothetical protein Tco_0519094 [Tanacetum coccineum]